MRKTNIKEQFFSESKKFFQCSLSRKFKSSEDWFNMLDRIIDDVIWDTMDIYEKEHFSCSNSEIKDMVKEKLNN